MDRGRRREVKESGRERRGKRRRERASETASSRSPSGKKVRRDLRARLDPAPKKKRRPQKQELAPRTLPSHDSEEEEVPPAVKEARAESERQKKVVSERKEVQPRKTPKQRTLTTLEGLFPRLLVDAETDYPDQWFVRCPAVGCTGKTKKWYCIVKNRGNSNVKDILAQKEVNSAVRSMLNHCWSLQDDGKHPPTHLLEAWTVELDKLEVEESPKKEEGPKSGRKDVPMWEEEGCSDSEGEYSKDASQKENEEEGEEESKEVDLPQEEKGHEAKDFKKGEAVKDVEACGEESQVRNKAKVKVPVPEPVAAPKPKVASSEAKPKGIFSYPVVARPPSGKPLESSSSESEKREDKIVAALKPPAPKSAPRELVGNKEASPKAGLPLMDAGSWSALHFKPVFPCPSSSSSKLKAGSIGAVLYDPFREVASKACDYCEQTAVRACANLNCQAWICADHSSRGKVGSHCGWRVCVNCCLDEDTSEEVSEILSSSSRAKALISLDDFGVFATSEAQDVQEDEEVPEFEDDAEEKEKDAGSEAAAEAKAEEEVADKAKVKVEQEQLLRKRKGGPVISSFRGSKERGSSAAALEIAKNSELFDVAIENFEQLTYAAGVKESKNAKFSLWSQLCEARGFAPLPLTADKIKEVGAVLRAARFRSGYSYLCEALQEHTRRGWPKTELLQVSLKDAERALTRGLGGPDKAAEVKLLWWDQVWEAGASAPLLVRQSDETKAHPAGGVFLWSFGSAMALREVELSCLCLDSVVLNKEELVVTVDLPASKKDPAARGCKRSRGCECGKKGDAIGESPPSCPFHSALFLQDLQSKRTGVGPTDVGASEVPFVGQNGFPDKFCSKKAVIDRLKEDAVTVKSMVPEAQGLTPEEVSGHTLRRSGIKDLARKGVSRPTCQWFARHSSDAVDGYIEEAAEESPLSDRKVLNEVSFLERLDEVRRRCNESFTVITGLKEDVAFLKGNEEQLRLEVEYGLKPEAVLNRATNKVHSTKPGSFIGPSLEWTTACGWNWVKAGRLAEPFRLRDRTAKHALCKTCTEYLKL